MGMGARLKDAALRARYRVEPKARRWYYLFRNLRGRRVFLDRLNVEFTSICNLRCRFCILDHEGNRGLMTRETLRKVLDEIRDRDRFSIRYLELHNGGETLLHPEFPAFLEDIARARRDGAAFREVRITTNATRLAGEKRDAIFESGAVDMVRVSMDGGTKEEFERIRVRARYEQVMGNVEAFLEENERRGKPVRTGLISVFTEREPVLDDRFRALSERVDHYTPRHPHAWDGSMDLGFGPPPRRPGGLCQFVANQLVVLWSGRVSPCCSDLNGRGPVGDLARDSLYAIARGRPRRRMWRLMRAGRRRDIPLCRNCDIP